MSFIDFLANAATGGAYGAIEAGIGALTPSSTPTNIPADPVTPSKSGGLGFGITPPIGAMLSGGLLPQQSKATCCDRFRLTDGFLVDGVTGLVWRFDETQKALVEVPRKPAEEKRPLIKAILEAQLQNVRDQYEAQIVSPLSPALRQEATKEFKKRFVKPFWDSAAVG